jgi:hypothetical protein
MASVTDWRVQLETPEGAASEEAQLERFAESLEQNDDALGPAASMDAARGTLSATFHVEAPDREEAAWKAFWVYLHAVWDADVVLTADSRLEVHEETRPEAETAELQTPVARFRARVQLEPEDA